MPMDPIPAPSTSSPEEFTAREYERSLLKVVSRLRDMIDEIEREGVPDLEATPVSGSGPYTHAASRVVHALAWGLANVTAGQLVVAASVADQNMLSKTDDATIAAALRRAAAEDVCNQPYLDVRGNEVIIDGTLYLKPGEVAAVTRVLGLTEEKEA